MSATITESLITAYLIRTTTGEYGHITIKLGEESAIFTAETSFGTYGHGWFSTGKDPLGFLTRISFDYMMGKCMGHELYVLDSHKTESKLANEIIRMRRNRLIDKDEARDLWQEKEEVTQHNGSTREYLTAVFLSEPLMNRLYGDDHSSIHYEEMPNPQAVGFWKEIWTPLVDHLKAKRATEQTQQPEEIA